MLKKNMVMQPNKIKTHAPCACKGKVALYGIQLIVEFKNQ